MAEFTRTQLASYIRKHGGLGNKGSDDDVIAYASRNNPQIENMAKSIGVSEPPSPRGFTPEELDPEFEALRKHAEGGYKSVPSKSIGGFIGNVGKSAVEFGKGVYNVASHPINTAVNVAQLGAGLVEKPFEATGISSPSVNTKKVDAVVDFFGNRYGSLKNASETLYNDPVGMASDVAAIAGGGAGIAAKYPQLAKIASALKTTSKVTEPLNLAGKTLGLAGGVTKSALGSLVPKVLKNVRDTTNLAGEYRNAVGSAIKELGETYGKEVDNLGKAYPKQRIPLVDVISEIKLNMVDNPKFASMVEGIPAIKEMLESSSKAPKLVSLETALEIKKALTSKIPQGKLAGTGIRPADLDALYTVGEINKAILGTFKEMKDINKAYGSGMNDLKLLRPSIKEGKTISSMKKGIGDQEIQKIVTQYIPAETVKQLGGYKKTWDILNAVPLKIGDNLGKLLEKNMLKPSKVNKGKVEAISKSLNQYYQVNRANIEEK